MSPNKCLLNDPLRKHPKRLIMSLTALVQQLPQYPLSLVCYSSAFPQKFKTINRASRLQFDSNKACTWTTHLRKKKLGDFPVMIRSKSRCRTTLLSFICCGDRLPFKWPEKRKWERCEFSRAISRAKSPTRLAIIYGWLHFPNVHWKCSALVKKRCRYRKSGRTLGFKQRPH